MNRGQSWRNRTMGNRQRQRGFTIVEVMVVLAVTGLIFGSVILLISGKQQSAEFDQSIHDVQAQIRQVINEVAAGYYPNSDSFTCRDTAHVQLANVSSPQPKGECVFLGKVLHFFDGGGTDSSLFSAYSITGLKSGTELAFAKPLLVAPTSSSPYSSYAANVDTTEHKHLLYGLTVNKMYYGSPPGTSIGSIAFVQTFNTAASGAGAPVSGAQHIETLAFPGSNLSYPDPTEVGGLDAALQSSSYVKNSPVTLCFVSGSTNQKGLITIGSNGNGVAVDLDIKSGTTCP